MLVTIKSRSSTSKRSQLTPPVTCTSKRERKTKEVHGGMFLPGSQMLTGSSQSSSLECKVIFFFFFADHSFHLINDQKCERRANEHCNCSPSLLSLVRRNSPLERLVPLVSLKSKFHTDMGSSDFT